MEKGKGGVSESEETRRGEVGSSPYFISMNFCSRSFDAPLAIIPTHSKRFENLLNFTKFDNLYKHCLWS